MTHPAQLQTLSLPVHGMTCTNCVTHVENALKRLAGISHVVVDLETSQVHLNYDQAVVDLIDVCNAVTEAGYTIPTQGISLRVLGMSCVSCLAHVEGALQNLPGVIAATVSLGEGTAQVQYIAEIVTVDQMERAVKDAGYEAHPQDPGSPPPEPHRKTHKNEFLQPGEGRKITDTAGVFAWVRKTFKKAGTSSR